MKKKTQVQRGRPAILPRILDALKEKGVFQLKDAKKLGISQSSLSRLVASGKILRVESGLYLHPDSSLEGVERDYVVACMKFGSGSVIGGMTALFHYHLIEEVPQRVWILVPYDRKTRHPTYRCLRTKTNPKVGIEDHGAYRITNLERTLVEAFRYASKMGLRTALHATRTAIQEHRTTLEKVHAQAKALGLVKFIEKYWETIIPESQGNV